MEQRIFLLCSSCRYILVFSDVYFSNSGILTLIQKLYKEEKKLLVGMKKETKNPVWVLWINFKLQHFVVQNSVKRKKKKHAVYKNATLQNILKTERAVFNLILT